MKPINRLDGPSAAQPSGRWLNPEEYLAMAVSTRKMERCDDPREGVRGLMDLDTGERFFVREEQALRSELYGHRQRDAAIY